MVLRKALQQRERHRQHVLGHRLRVGAGIRRKRDAAREPVEWHVVDASGEQLDEPCRRELLRLVGPAQLARGAPREHGVGRSQRTGALGVLELRQNGDGCDPAKLLPERLEDLRRRTERDEDVVLIGHHREITFSVFASLAASAKQVIDMEPPMTPSVITLTLCPDALAMPANWTSGQK